MPLIKDSSYKPPFLFKNRHLQTIFPILFRKAKNVKYVREKIDTPDEDFIHLDWSRRGSREVVLVMDGLEGQSDHKNIRGLVSIFNKNGYDAVAYNYRGCSGVANLKPYSYHAGSTGDLDVVIRHILSDNKYTAVYIAACSFGGNMVLKYLGEKGSDIDGRIKRAVCYSVPCDLAGSARRVSEQKVYITNFLQAYKGKILRKNKIMPDKIDASGFDRIKSFKEYDNRYTAPLNGFENAEAYWEKATCLPLLDNIRVPVLLFSAKDDPFLTGKSYPVEAAERSEYFYLEVPEFGGHAGFILFNGENEYWFERRIVEFFGGE